MPDIEAILVNHADPTGEIANIIAGGSAANGAVVGAVRGALVSFGQASEYPWPQILSEGRQGARWNRQ